MKVFEGSSFTTTMPFNGVLPVMPVVDGADQGRLKTYVRQVAWKDDLFPPGLGAHPDRDTYWVGKSMGKLATVLQIADQIGDTNDRDYAVRALENELQDWFDGRAPKLLLLRQDLGDAGRRARQLRVGRRSQRPPLSLRLLPAGRRGHRPLRRRSGRRPGRRF